MLAAIMVVVGILQLAHWHKVFGMAFDARKMVVFAPSFALAASFIFTKRLANKSAHTMAICLGLLAFGFWGLLSLVLEAQGEMFGPIIDVGKYASVIDDYRSFNKELVSHFPRPIPPDAKNVHFYFTPHFGMGGAVVQLRCTLPAAEVSSLYVRFAKQTSKSFNGGNFFENENTENGVPTTDFYTGDSPDHIFPKDYEVMVFDSANKKGSPESNDTLSHGVAISKERNEIVYWAQTF